MEVKGINILEETLRKNCGKNAIISISHKLYGDQKVRCALDPIFDHRVGFRVKPGQEIFIYVGDVVNFGVEDGIYFADELMEINIKL